MTCKTVAMTDDPFDGSTMLPTRTVGTPGERLWELRQDHITWSCELRYHGEWGVEAQILRNGALHLSQRLPLHVEAVKWAEDYGRDFELNSSGC